jgi:Predicted nucleotide-binding protein containing TIR-like domain
MAKENFNIIIMHGHSKEYEKVRDEIRDMGFNPIVLMEDFGGDIILNRVRDSVWDETHCAIIVMSPDDKMCRLEVRSTS